MNRIVGGGARERLTGGRMAEVSRPLPYTKTADCAPAAQGFPSGVDGLVIARLAESVTQRLLDVRRKHLNGRAPKSQSVHRLRRDLSCGKVRAIHSVLRIVDCDLEDGAPTQAVSGVFRFIADLVDARGAERRSDRLEAPSMLSAIQREARKQFAADVEERDVLDAAGDPEREARELTELLDAYATEIEAKQAVMADARQRLARLTLAGAR